MKFALRVLIPLMTVVLIVVSVSAFAQVNEQQPVFSELFPRPTGQNGYEEIIAAGDMLSKSTLLDDFVKKPRNTGTLTEMRAVLADPPVRDALILFRQGMSKSLRAQSGEPDVAIRALGLYRQISRVLAVELYVQCADGSINHSIDTLLDALRLGYAIRSDSLLGVMVGSATDSLMVSTMKMHLDQFSERDCKRLSQLAREWLDAPDPAIAALTAERDKALKTIQSQFPADPEFPRDQILTGMKLHLDHFIDNLSKPYWERKPAPPLQGDKRVVDYVSALTQWRDPSYARGRGDICSRSG